MYVVNIKKTKVHQQGEYAFKTKKETQSFLESLNDYELECIISIEKYNKHSFRSAWDDFFIK